MEALLIYAIKVNLALALFYAFYKLLFAKDTFLHIRRWLLLSFYFIAFTYSFIHVPEWVAMRQADPTSLVARLPEFIAELTGQGQNTAETMTDSGLLSALIWPTSWFNLLAGIYLLGVIVLTLRSVLEVRKTCNAIRRSKKLTIGNATLYCHPHEQDSYSFFNWISINPDLYTAQEFSEILTHEQTHVRQGHSYDIILAQLVTVLCWPNPFAWLLRSEMKLNHEYLADKEVVNSGYNKKAYQYHLIGLTQNQPAIATIYNNFSVLPLKNRIKMMNRKKTKNIMLSKLLMFIPALALLVFFANCSDTNNNTADEIQYVPEEVVSAETTTNEETTTKTEAFDITEKMPDFPGGISAFMSYLSDNIKYPADAEKEGVQGRVIVQFVVEKDGSASDFRVVRSIRSDLDEEALRVLKQMPKWVPGENKGEKVRVKYTVPIMFKLTPKDNKAE